MVDDGTPSRDDDSTADGDGPETDLGAGEELPVDVGDARERLEGGADRAVEEFDQGIVDLLAWLLDTETRARIYVFLRQHPDATSDEIAEGTGLYPSTVREALVDLHEEATVERRKRQSDGAGNNPYEYRAIPPSDLVSNAVGDLQSELNAVFNLDDRLGGATADSDTDPVSITVEDADEDSSTAGD